MNRPFLNYQHNVFLGTRALPCPYIPGQTERKVVTDLAVQEASDLYDRLSRAGFRRSHSLAYKPACPNCSACIPVRIKVEKFRYTKSFRQIINRNADFSSQDMVAHATLEQFKLFQRYQKTRHTGGEMELMGFHDYRAMIEDSPVDSRIIEFRQRTTDELKGVMLADRQADALSAVYSFYDASERRRSLGTFMVLSLILQAIKTKTPYIYLGYWVEESPKMSYKTRFKPVEVFRSGTWQELQG